MPGCPTRCHGATLLAQNGAAVTVVSPDAAPPVDVLVSALAEALRRRRAEPESARAAAAVATDGVPVTADLLTRLVAGEDPWASEWLEHAR